jgi:xylulokinase
MGIDVGTSSIKVLLVDASGDIQGSGSAPLTMETPRPGWAEQDPEAWWQATVSALKDAVGRRPAAQIASIGLSGQMHSSVFLDETGKVIRPALLWCDGRTTAECKEIVSRVGGEEVLRELVRNPALEGFTLPKILWLRNHEPEAYRRLSKVLLAKDFIRFRLTGALATEPSDASGTLMFDPARLAWSDQLLRAVDVGRQLLPDVGGSSAAERTMPAARPASASSRWGRRSRAGGRQAPCSLRQRSRWWIPDCVPTRSVMSCPTRGTSLASS